ncbi:MAG: TRAM domain-containing protein [Bacillota bacterium]|jgi:tRNA/tmRNA/rRNA uracil-C5-methylase (TrmA/RlmC/RlmD family)
MLTKNQMVDLEITDTTIEGMGVGRTDEGQVVFIPAATAGQSGQR